MTDPREPEDLDALWRRARDVRAPRDLWPRIAARVDGERAPRSRLVTRLAAGLLGAALFLAVAPSRRSVPPSCGPDAAHVDRLLADALPALRLPGDPFEAFAETRLVTTLLKR